MVCVRTSVFAIGAAFVCGFASASPSSRERSASDIVLPNSNVISAQTCSQLNSCALLLATGNLLDVSGYTPCGNDDYIVPDDDLFPAELGENQDDVTQALIAAKQQYCLSLFSSNFEVTPQTAGRHVCYTC